MKKIFCLSLAMTVFAISSWSQASSPITISAFPTLDIPFGISIEGSEGTSLYGLGYGVAVRGQYAMGFHAPLSAGLVLDADLMTPNGSSKTAAFIGGSGEIAYTLSLASRLSLRAGNRGGM